MRLSEAEWKVMDVLWRRDGATVREVLEVVETETGWAYSTTKTMLSRLVEKGAVRSEMRLNSRWFEAVVTRDAARRSALRSLLDRAFDGTFGSLVQHMVKDRDLSPEEQEVLAAIARGGEGAAEVDLTSDFSDSDDPKQDKS